MDIEIHSSRVASLACLDPVVAVDTEIHSSSLGLVVVDIDTQRHRVPCQVLVDIDMVRHRMPCLLVMDKMVAMAVAVAVAVVEMMVVV